MQGSPHQCWTRQTHTSFSPWLHYTAPRPKNNVCTVHAHGKTFAVSQDTASSQLTTPKRYTEVHSSSVPVYHPSTSFVLKLSHQHLHGLPSTHFRNGIATTVHVFWRLPATHHETFAASIHLKTLVPIFIQRFPDVVLTRNRLPFSTLLRSYYLCV